MTSPEEPIRRRWNIGAFKIPAIDRDIVQLVFLADSLRGYFDIMGADSPDDDEKWVLGSKVAYSLELTDDEAELFASASNVRYVELDGFTTADSGNMTSPSGTSQKYMGMEFPGTDSWHGRDVNIAILDGGVTTAINTYMDWTVVGRQVFGGYVPGADEITTNHGCLVAPCAVPRGGRIMDAIIADDNGQSAFSAFSAAVTWAVDNGAKVINYSYSGTSAAQALQDGVEYAQSAGVAIVSSAGNDGLNQIGYPAAYSRTYNNVFSSGNFDENTNARDSTSNFHVDLSGVAPGARVLGFTPAATFTFWSGTSASSPHMAGLVARMCTGGQYTALQAAGALKTYARNTGQAADQQGAGAWDLKAALTGAGATLAPTPINRTNLCPNPSLETVTTGFSIVSTRTGITTSPSVSRGTTIAGHAGPTYGFINITGNGSLSEDPDVVLGLPDCTVTAGGTYTISTHIRFGTSTLVWGPVELRIDWRNAAGTSLGTVTSAKESLMVVSWFRYFVTGTAPTGAVRAVITARVYGCTNTAAQSMRFDALLYEAATAPLFYFDGNTTPGGAWTGTVAASTSTMQVAAAQTLAVSASIAGAGAVTAAATVPATLAGSATLAGAGAVDAQATGAGPTTHVGSASVAGVGAVAAAATVATPSSDALSVGPSTIAALRVGTTAAVRAYLGTTLVWGTAPSGDRASVAGDGQVTAAATATLVGSVSVAGVGAVSADGTVGAAATFAGSAAIAGAGAITADATGSAATQAGSATIAGDGQVAADGTVAAVAAINGATPAAVISNTSVTTLTTAAFTPPVGAVLLMVALLDTATSTRTGTPSTVTGSTSAWTTVENFNNGDGASGGLVHISWARVTTSQSTTARVTWPVASDCAMKVWVLTGTPATGSPIGRSGGTTLSTNPQTVSYAATGPGSQGFLGIEDFTQAGAKAISNTTTEATLATNSNGIIARDSAVATAVGQTRSFSISGTPGGSAVAWVEVIGAGTAAAAASSTGGSGGPQTDRTNVSYNNGTKTSVGHIYAAGLDWTKRVGVLVYGDGSGEFGLANPTDTYLLAGTNGLVAVAKRLNMVLVTPRAPGDGCLDGDGVCWYDASNNGTTIAQKIKWCEDFIQTQVLTKYNIDQTRVCIAGYSSGAQLTSEYYGPQYAPPWMEDGLLLSISFGGSPKVQPNFSTAFKQRVAAVWDVGALDPAYQDSGDFGVQAGYDWYTANGFPTTELNVVAGLGHDRDGQFGAICEREITQHVPAAFAPGPQANVTAPAGAVVVNPGDNIATAAGTAGVGGTLFFAAGTHRITATVTPGQGQTWIGADGAAINGSVLVPNTGWTAGTNQWSRVVTTLPTTPAAFTAYPTGSNPNAELREDVWVDKAPITRVATAAAVNSPGKYFIDYPTRTLYLGTNPAGKVIEHANVDRVLSGSTSGVTLRNLIFEGGKPDNGRGMVVADTATGGWTVENCLFRMSHYSGLSLYGELRSNGHRIQGNRFENLGGSGADCWQINGITFQLNEATGCNAGGFDPGWDAAGVKFTVSDGIVMSRNRSHHNSGTGLWIDIDCVNPVLEYNTVEDNTHHGIHQEISYDGIIRYNQVHRNASCGILINTIDGCEVHNNTVSNSNPGGGVNNADILIIDGGDRGSSARFGTAYHGLNNEIHHNTVTHTVAQTGAIVGLWYQTGAIPAAQTTNTWHDNTYTVSSTTWAGFQWTSKQTFATWQSAGRDSGSTITTA